MSGMQIASLASIVACLFLATRAWQARSAGMPFETKAAMVAAWVLIFAVLAFAMERLAG